jgi:hypothetical protein
MDFMIAVFNPDARRPSKFFMVWEFAWRSTANTGYQTVASFTGRSLLPSKCGEKSVTVFGKEQAELGSVKVVYGNTKKRRF